MSSRLSNRVATARYCLSLLKHRSTLLRSLYRVRSKAGGRAAAGAAAAAAVGFLVFLDRDDRRAHRRRTMSRCHRKMVPGVTISRIAARRPAGSVPASRASHARSGHVSRARRQRADAGASRSRRPPPRFAPRHAQQRYRTGDNQEDQLQAHKPKIIPPPARPSSRPPDTGRNRPALLRASAQVA